MYVNYKLYLISTKIIIHIHFLQEINNFIQQKTLNWSKIKCFKRCLFQINTVYIYIYAFSRHFYPKRLTLHSSYSFTFYQLLLSLGIEPMILALLAPCSTIWATGNKYCSFEISKCHSKVKCNTNLTKYQVAQSFSTLIRHFSWAANQHIRMFSEWSCDTEDWSNGCWKFSFSITGIKLLKKKTNSFNNHKLIIFFD